MTQDSTGRPLPPPRPRTAINPLCYACGTEIDGGRVIWTPRKGKLEPHHPRCAHPAPRVHGVVIR